MECVDWTTIGPRGYLRGSMEIRLFTPHPRLRAHVARIWIVESPVGWKPADIRTIVPNGNMKLVFPYRGALLNRAATPVDRHTVALRTPSAAVSAGTSPYQVNPQNTLWVLGLSDRPWTVDADGPFGVLTVELRPGAASLFFPVPLGELRNQVTPASDLLGDAAREIEDRLAEARGSEERVQLVQAFLLGLLAGGRFPDEIVAWAVSCITSRGGLVTVNELTTKLGYSQRYLAMKFERFVGLAPKTLAEIVRFQNRFSALTRFGSPESAAAFDEDYYDQSHFVREFKRFAGLPPGEYLKTTREFLTLFYGTGTPGATEA